MTTYNKLAQDDRYVTFEEIVDGVAIRQFTIDLERDEIESSFDYPADEEWQYEQTTRDKIEAGRQQMEWASQEDPFWGEVDQYWFEYDLAQDTPCDEDDGYTIEDAPCECKQEPEQFDDHIKSYYVSGLIC